MADSVQLFTDTVELSHVKAPRQQPAGVLVRPTSAAPLAPPSLPSYDLNPVDRLETTSAPADRKAFLQNRVYVAQALLTPSYAGKISA